MQYGFSFNAARCTGCKTCQCSCRDYNDIPPEYHVRKIYEIVGGAWSPNDDGSTSQDILTYFVSHGCNHCASPACVEACPTGATTKDEETGLVSNDHDACIGCGSCAKACPYGIPFVNKELKIANRCTGCLDRVREGGRPICVESCPVRALDFGPIDDLRKTYGDTCDVFPLADSGNTGPSLVIGLPKCNVADDSSLEIVNPQEVTNEA